jgi:hypothetical protein
MELKQIASGEYRRSELDQSLAFLLVALQWDRPNLRFTMKRTSGNDCDGFGDSVRALAASAGIQFGDLQAEA